MREKYTSQEYQGIKKLMDSLQTTATLRHLNVFVYLVTLLYLIWRGIYEMIYYFIVDQFSV